MRCHCMLEAGVLEATPPTHLRALLYCTSLPGMELLEYGKRRITLNVHFLPSLFKSPVKHLSWQMLQRLFGEMDVMYGDELDAKQQQP